MNNQTCNEVRIELKKAMKDIEKKFGVTVEFGSMTYNSNEIRTKTTIRKIGALDKTIEQYELQSKLDPRFPKLGTKLQDGTTVCGYNTRARKYPIITENNGKKYKMSIEDMFSKI